MRCVGTPAYNALPSHGDRALPGRDSTHCLLRCAPSLPRQSGHGEAGFGAHTPGPGGGTSI